MTQERILKLACDAALMNWANEKDKLEEHPDNTITRYREEKNWNELKELEKMLRELRGFEG